jgi:type II secretion system protein H
MASEAKRRRHASSPGYTLIEILVVLAVIGIAIALVRVQFARSPTQVLEDEARRLALVFELARDEAMTSGCTLAWIRRGEAHGLACRRGPSNSLARSDSLAAGRDETYSTRPWPPQVALERISVAGTAVPRDSPLFFTPSGINAPFELVLAHEGHRVALSGDALGRVKVARREFQQGAQR